MPYFDGTGPAGEGLRSGRGFGPCNSNSGSSPRQFNSPPGRGFNKNRNFTYESDFMVRLSALKEEVKKLK